MRCFLQIGRGLDGVFVPAAAVHSAVDNFNVGVGSAKNSGLGICELAQRRATSCRSTCFRERSKPKVSWCYGAKNNLALAMASCGY